LSIWVNETISDGHTFEIDLQLILVLEEEVVGDSWNIMSSITFTGDIEVFTLELWEFLQKVDHEGSHGFSNFIFIGVKVGITSNF